LDGPAEQVAAAILRIEQRRHLASRPFPIPDAIAMRELEQIALSGWPIRSGGWRSSDVGPRF